jgi:hypothetical protein
MREVSAADRDRLVESNRRLVRNLVIALAVTIAVVIAIGLVFEGVTLALLGPALGLLIGYLLVLPQRRLVRELGLAPDEARQIIGQERARRREAARGSGSGAAHLHRRWALWLAIGAVASVAAVVGGSYCFVVGLSADAFGLVFWSTAGALILACYAFAAASAARKQIQAAGGGPAGR